MWRKTEGKGITWASESSESSKWRSASGTVVGTFLHLLRDFGQEDESLRAFFIHTWPKIRGMEGRSSGRKANIQLTRCRSAAPAWNEEKKENGHGQERGMCRTAYLRRSDRGKVVRPDQFICRLLVVSLERRLSHHHVIGYATRCPDVHRRRVPLLVQHLRRSVSNSNRAVGFLQQRAWYYLGTDVVRCAADASALWANAVCETEVADLEDQIPIHVNVRWLEIPVDYAAVVDVLQSGEYLLQEAPGLVLAEPFVRPQQLGQVVHLAMLHDHIELGVVVEVCFQPNDIFVFHHAMNINLFHYLTELHFPVATLEKRTFFKANRFFRPGEIINCVRGGRYYCR